MKPQAKTCPSDKVALHMCCPPFALEIVQETKRWHVSLCCTSEKNGTRSTSLRQIHHLWCEAICVRTLEEHNPSSNTWAEWGAGGSESSKTKVWEFFHRNKQPSTKFRRFPGMKVKHRRSEAKVRSASRLRTPVFRRQTGSSAAPGRTSPRLCSCFSLRK